VLIYYLNRFLKSVIGFSKNTKIKVDINKHKNQYKIYMLNANEVVQPSPPLLLLKNIAATTPLFIKYSE
jgi:hypothetical protein